MGVAPGQLRFQIFEASLLADRLPDRSRCRTGAERLLLALVRAGPSEDALPAAAALALELDRARREVSA